MTPERITQCLSYGLSVFWANEGYTCSGIGNKLWVTWNKGGRDENTAGLEGNHDLTKFYPNPAQIRAVIDTEYDLFADARPALLSRPSRLVKFDHAGEKAWVCVLDFAGDGLPDVGLATELAIEAMVPHGLGAEHVLVVI